MAEIGQTLRPEFSTPSLSTGALAAPDALPTAVLRRNGATVAAAAVTITLLATGRYLASVLLDPEHGWAVGDSYSVDASWAMGGVAVGGPVAQGVLRNIEAQFATLQADLEAAISDIADIQDILSLGLSGAISFTYTVYRPDGVTPLPGCSVYVTENADGSGRRSPTAVTDALGRAVFALDGGTYYFWRSHPGYTFNNPDEETVG